MVIPLTVDSHIKFRHLHCFLAVVQHGSLQAAATALSITQPAVSKTIRELEEILQITLFERGPKGATMSHDAQGFFEHAQTAVDALRQAVGSAAQARGLGDPVIRLGASPTLTASFVPTVLLALRQRLGSIQISLHSGTTQYLITQLREREFDLVLCRHFDPEQMVGLSFEYLFTDPLVVMVRPGHPLHTNHVVRTSDLCHFTAVLPVKGSINRYMFDKLAREHDLSIAGDFVETMSFTSGRIYTISSDAIWFVPWSAVRHDVDAGALVRLQLPVRDSEGHAEVIARTIGVMTRANAPPAPAVRTLINLIREVAAERRAETV